MIINSRTQKQVFLHVIFWIAYGALNYLINVVQRIGEKVYVLDSIGKYLGAAFIFYTTAFVILPLFFSKRRYFLLVLGILVVLVTCDLLKSFLYFNLFPRFGFPPSPYTHTAFFIMNFWWWSQYTLFAFGYWFGLDAIRKQKELRLKEQRQLKTEQQMLTLENERLRAQINPHFLFNTLNYLYNKVGQQQPEVADGIAALSDIMRSSIRKPDEDGLIPLEEEISNIEQLISIYELRYDHSVYISFNQQGSSLDLRILPHTLNTLVENAFKHGELHNADHPLTITLNIEDNQLHFAVHDKKRIGPKELSHGIGMHYIRTHLNSVYNDRYSLNIVEDKEFYTITLNIDLKTADSVRLNEEAVNEIY